MFSNLSNVSTDLDLSDKPWKLFISIQAKQSINKEMRIVI